MFLSRASPAEQLESWRYRLSREYYGGLFRLNVHPKYGTLHKWTHVLHGCAVNITKGCAIDGKLTEKLAKRVSTPAWRYTAETGEARWPRDQGS